MNPVSKLNELRQGIVYNVKSRTGSDHEPTFTVTVEVYSQITNSMKCFHRRYRVSRRLTVNIT